jgi:rod shape-determining protein MreC
MRRRSSGVRLPFFGLLLVGCLVLIVMSGGGGLDALRGIVEIPFNALAGLVNRASSGAEQLTQGQRTYEELAQYAADLETALALLSEEVVTLREIGADYQRLAEIADYASQAQNQESISADVIARDTISSLRTITINRGQRDGVRRGNPVVVGRNLIGRVITVSANAARVQLINAESSAVSARLQTNRIEGSVIGQVSGNLRMTLLPQGASVQVGDLVLTSGLGGTLPPDLVIGQVTSTRQFESDIEQSAEVRSLIDFDTQEIVMVITSFEPVEMSVFEPTAIAP